MAENCDLRNVNVSCCECDLMFEGDCLVKSFDELIPLFVELVIVVAVNISMNVAVVAAV